MAEEPLCEDKQIKIEYHSTSPEDHVLFIKDGKEELNYLLERGILKDLAETPRGELEKKIYNFNSVILTQLKEEGIAVDGLHVALCQAYMEEKRREYKATGKTIF